MLQADLDTLTSRALERIETSCDDPQALAYLERRFPGRTVRRQG